MPTMIRSSLSVSLLLLLLPVAALVASAQEQSPGLSIPEALRREQTSSPRQTLTRFLANSRAAIEDVRDGSLLSEEGLWYYVRAIDALDYSATPHSGASNVRTERVLLLREILDRIPLPPAEEIPGDREVADGTIERWAIPGTRLEIARIDSGPREGEFLFSSETVERLESLYRMVKDLPAKPGSLAGFYETFIGSERGSPTRERHMRNRLKGVDVSSPRSTFDGFLDSVNRAYRLVMEADAAMKADPPTMKREEAIEVDIQAGNLLRRAAGTLDLTQVPAANREDVGLETALQLKEILDRMSLPPIGSIPNERMVRGARRGEGGSVLRADEPFRWKYPNTELEIVEMMGGDNQGGFFLSAESVARVHTDFLAVRDLPYRPELPGGAALEYLSPEN
jgi:MscS family membrane protein